MGIAPLGLGGFVGIHPQGDALGYGVAAPLARMNRESQPHRFSPPTLHIIRAKDAKPRVLRRWRGRTVNHSLIDSRHRLFISSAPKVQNPTARGIAPGCR
jgi:hypothetical protein